jgi:hypothetical protein
MGFVPQRSSQSLSTELFGHVDTTNPAGLVVPHQSGGVFVDV